MKKSRMIYLMTILAISIFTFPKSTLAGEGTLGDYFTEIGTKFGRGLVNVVSSPAEIVCTPMIDSRRGEGNAFSSTGKGVLFFLRRALVGVTEVGTFIIPMDATLPAVCHETIA